MTLPDSTLLGSIHSLFNILLLILGPRFYTLYTLDSRDSRDSRLCRLLTPL